MNRTSSEEMPSITTVVVFGTDKSKIVLGKTDFTLILNPTI